MSMPQINTDFIQARMNRSVPGESFANDPDTPLPFEKAPQFTSINKASEFIFEKITEEENYMQFMEVIAGGASLMEIAKVLLYSMYEEGKINPDLLILLIEPTVYILMALCERADIPFTIDGELGEEEELDGNSENYEILQRLQEAQRSNEIPLPEAIEQRLQELRPPPQESPPEQPSLLGMEQ
jgi:hypothetical protein|tara:strand:+ start:4333 stop:4884 length:552 start_codon:yes stop_codon:yes gene_type:complete